MSSSDIALDVSIYIHRFHNLDLFQQGWYALKITCRWDDETGLGVPTRVVQYEASEATTDGISTIWHINDEEHSFCSRPFKIKFLREDVTLAVMVSFSLPVNSVESMTRSSVLIKFELLFAPLEGFLFFNSMHLELPSVSSHSYRIPPNALHGVHSYCPLHFDSWHMAHVELFLHTVLVSILHYAVPSQTTSSELEFEMEEKNKALMNILRNSRSLLRDQLVQLRSKCVDDDSETHFSLIEESGDMENFKSLSIHLSALWNLFLKLHRANRDSLCKTLRKIWVEERSTEWSLWIVNSKLNNDATLSEVRKNTRKNQDDPATSSATRAELYRKGLSQYNKNAGSCVQDLQIFHTPFQQPIIFVEQLHKTATELNQILSHNLNSMRDELRIVVFVHGFQGHHLDLRLVRNHWLVLDPNAEILMSQANEAHPNSTFSEFGQRLAVEVSTFIKKKLDKTTKYGRTKRCRISFVGHSIGNLIIRAALMESALRPYLREMCTFVSISGPHLGYLYSSNLLFNSGLWVMKKLKSSPFMHELTFTDKSDIKDCFLFKLNQENNLNCFRHVFLLSSPQDRYVPYHSARIEMCQAAVRDVKRGSGYACMLNKCIQQLESSSTFVRCDVNFDISSHSGTLNNLIGRSAHIEFLETDCFIRFIMWTFPQCFT